MTIFSMKLKIWFIFSLFAGIHSTLVHSMHCYSCESVYNEECGDNFEPAQHFKLDCSRVAPPRYMSFDLESKNATACLKLVYKENTVYKVIRSCFFGNLNESNFGCQIDPTLLGIKNIGCHVCANEHFCNGNQPIIFAHCLTMIIVLLIWTLAVS